MEHNLKKNKKMVKSINEDSKEEFVNTSRWRVTAVTTQVVEPLSGTDKDGQTMSQTLSNEKSIFDSTTLC